MNFADSPPFRELNRYGVWCDVCLYCVDNFVTGIYVIVASKKVARPPVSGLVIYCQSLFKRHGKNIYHRLAGYCRHGARRAIQQHQP